MNNCFLVHKELINGKILVTLQHETEDGHLYMFVVPVCRSTGAGVAEAGQERG
jgi:hypothetical protein